MQLTTRTRLILTALVLVLGVGIGLLLRGGEPPLLDATVSPPERTLPPALELTPPPAPTDRPTGDRPSPRVVPGGGPS